MVATKWCSSCGRAVAWKCERCILCEKAFVAGQASERAACIAIIEDHDSCDIDTILNSLNALVP